MYPGWIAPLALPPPLACSDPGGRRSGGRGPADLGAKAPHRRPLISRRRGSPTTGRLSRNRLYSPMRRIAGGAAKRIRPHRPPRDLDRRWGSRQRGRGRRTCRVPVDTQSGVGPCRESRGHRTFLGAPRRSAPGWRRSGRTAVDLGAGSLDIRIAAEAGARCRRKHAKTSFSSSDPEARLPGRSEFRSGAALRFREPPPRPFERSCGCGPIFAQASAGRLAAVRGVCAWLRVEMTRGPGKAGSRADVVGRSTARRFRTAARLEPQPGVRAFCCGLIPRPRDTVQKGEPAGPQAASGRAPFTAT